MSSLTTDNCQLTTSSLIITVDTEEEGLWNGEYRRTGNTVENTRGILRFQELCDRFGIHPTYLVDAPVVQDDRSVKLLRSIQEDGQCEIGGHVHPWCNPPYEEELNERNSYLCNLPEKLQRAKLEWLTEAIERRFGRRPTSFRAGRYGLDIRGARLLRELGYQVDSSVIPFSDFSSEGGPDFQDAPYRPYYVNGAELCRPEGTRLEAGGWGQEANASSQQSAVSGQRPGGSGQGPEVRGPGSGGTSPQLTTDNWQLATPPALLEVPVSVGYSRRDFRRAHSLRSWAMRSALRRRLRVVGILDRLGIARRIKFSPEQATARQMIRLADLYLRHGASCLVLMFHSSSLVPGRSPYVPGAGALEMFYCRLEHVLEHCLSKRSCLPAVLSELGKADSCWSAAELAGSGRVQADGSSGKRA